MASGDPQDLELIRQATRDLARRFDLGYWREKDKKGEYPGSSSPLSPTEGWLGAMIPEEYGGLGKLGLTESAVMMGEIAASGSGLSGGSAIHSYSLPAARFCGMARRRWRSVSTCPSWPAAGC